MKTLLGGTMCSLTLQVIAGVWVPGMMSAAPVQRVVQVSVDGLAANHLHFYVTNAPDQFPNFVRLIREGASTFNARCDYGVSLTVPNHATMLTGRPVLQPADMPDTTHHGYSNNFPWPTDTFHNAGNPNVPYKASSFDVAHDHGLKTALFVSKTRLGICDRSYDETHGAEDLIGEDHGRDKIDFAVVNDGPITALVDALVPHLTNAFPTYTFVHLREPDITGHSYGWGSAAFSNATRLVDAQLGRMLAVLDSHPAWAGQTTLIVITDHGGGGDPFNIYNHMDPTHPANYTIPFFLWGRGIPAEVDAYTLFANRADPDTNRPSYTAVPQPLRNGDSSNLAMTLLGLPMIPGSLMVPVLAPRGIAVRIQRSSTALTVSWPSSTDGFELEWADTLAGTGVWQTITNGIADDGNAKTYTLPHPSADIRFFRLRKPPMPR